MMRTADELAAAINQNAEAILAAIRQKDIDRYRDLETGYKTTDVYRNADYRRKFQSYYGMGFVSEPYADRFFDLFERQKDAPPTFAGLSAGLFEVEGRHQLSFISKLLHTFNESRPVFDSHVCAMFGIKRHAGTIGARIAEDERLLDGMSSVYSRMEQQGLAAAAVAAFDRKFPDSGISFVKKADFFLRKLDELSRGAGAGARTPEAAGIKPGRYRHFKGNEYEVLYLAAHSETGEPMVVYRALYGGFGVWVRPASMWNEEVTRDGVTFKRFVYIGR
jgi:hypothetical protein